MNKRKYRINLYKVIWPPLVILVISFVVLTMIMAQFYKINDEKQLNQSVKNILTDQESYIANEIFLNERVSLGKRTQAIVDRAIAYSKDGVVCISIKPTYGDMDRDEITACSRGANKSLFKSSEKVESKVLLIGKTEIAKLQYVAFLKSKITCYLPIRLIFAMALALIITLLLYLVLVKKIHKSAIDPLLRQVEKNASERAVSELAIQVAHDIRSSLVSLEIITNGLSGVDEEKRIMIKNSVDMLKDLANNVLLPVKNKEEVAGVIKEQAEPLAILLERMISEKRAQISKDILLSFNVDREMYAVFVKIDNIVFKRVITNIVNNAIEAIQCRAESRQEEPRGEIKIKLRPDWSQTQKRMKIEINDNGCGVEAGNVDRILKGGVSIGKKGGTGVGLSSSKKLIESYGGELEIQSKIGEGTTVTICLFISPPAPWFSSELDLYQNSEVLILDDDRTIHDAWDQRLKAFITPADNVNLKHYTSPEQFIEYYNNNRQKLVTGLVDYELINSDKTGLDVIKELGLEKSAVLVTSRYENHLLREESVKIGVKILPKNFVPYIDINVIPSDPDIILIDDHETLAAAWKMLGVKKGKKVATFNSAKEFWKQRLFFKLGTPIYIDSVLKNDELSGEEFSKKLYEMGFLNIYLETGKDIDEDVRKHWYWIKEVVGKTPPF